MKTIETWFLWLMIYSIIGWVYESTICSIGHRKLINRGFLNGPYCPIYGTGAVLVLLFFAGALVTCSLEYLTSWLMEKLFHARWWDYSKRKFNIGGRVCLNAQQRRTIYSFPHLTLTRNNEVLDGLRQNMEKVRQRAKKTS